MTQDKRSSSVKYLDQDNLNYLAEARWAKKRKAIQECFTNGGECSLIDNWPLGDEWNIIHPSVRKESRLAGRRGLPAYQPQFPVLAVNIVTGMCCLGTASSRNLIIGC